MHPLRKFSDFSKLHYSAKAVPLSLCPTEDAITAHGLAMGFTPYPRSASTVTMPPGSASDIEGLVIIKKF